MIVKMFVVGIMNAVMKTIDFKNIDSTPEIICFDVGGGINIFESMSLSLLQPLLQSQPLPKYCRTNRIVTSFDPKLHAKSSPHQKVFQHHSA